MDTTSSNDSLRMGAAVTADGKYEETSSCDFCKRSVTSMRRVGYNRPSVCNDCQSRRIKRYSPKTVGTDVPLTDSVVSLLASLRAAETPQEQH